MATEIIIKENGEIKLSSNVLDFMRHSDKDTLCWNCAKGYPSKCPKIADIEKQPIEEYPFITNGYQVYKDGKTAKFAVFECTDFKSAKSGQPMSTSERFRLMDNIAMGYYGTDNVRAVRNTIAKNLKKNR